MRHTADTINDDQLDALYERLEAAEGVVRRVHAVAAEHRTRVAECEAEHQAADGPLPLGHPMALWCDTVANICSDIEYALRAPAPPSFVAVTGEAGR